MRGRGRLVVAAGGLLVTLGLAVVYDRPPAIPGAWMAAAGLEAREAIVEGHRLRYVRTGEGPPVVLVHGFGSSLYTWKGVVPALARAHDVVALDLPGFGWSDQPPDLTCDDFPAAIVGLMDRLGVDRAALVGNSMGGAAAALVAAEYPTRVSALVLVDAAGFNLAPSARPALLRFVMSPAGRLLRVLPVRRLAVELALRQVFHDDTLVTDERVAEYLAPVVRPGALASVRSLGGSPRRDASGLSEVLARIRAPTLVLWGRDDAWIPLSHAELFVAAVPGSRKVVLDGCGHVPQEEKPEDTARLLREFLESAERRTAT